MHHYAPEGTIAIPSNQGERWISVLAFLPHGTANSRVDELRATARSRFELEALAIEKYQKDVLAYRVYLKLPAHEVQPYPRRQQPQARRSMG